MYKIWTTFTNPFLFAGSDTTMFNIDKNGTFRVNKCNYEGNIILTKPKLYRINIRIQEHSIVHTGGLGGREGRGGGVMIGLSLLLTGSNDITTVLMFCQYVVTSPVSPPTTNNIILTSD